MIFLFFSGQPPLSSQDTNIKLAEFDIDLLEGMFIVLGYTYLFYAMLDSQLDFEGKCKDKFPTVCLCVLLLFPDDISKSLSAFFFAMQFCSTTKKKLKGDTYWFLHKKSLKLSPPPISTNALHENQ